MDKLKSTTVRMDQRLHKLLKTKSIEEDRPLSDIINEAVINYLATRGVKIE